jgi:hypothetical protein
VVVIRCTKRLLRRIGPLVSDADRSTTRLGDWYANLINVGHQHLVLCISEHTRLPVLLPGRELKLLGAHLAAAAAAVLERLGVARERISEELAHMQSVSIGPTINRSLVASMNDYGRMVRLGERPDDVLDVSLRLAETPILVLDGESPRVMARRLFGVAEAIAKQPSIPTHQPPNAIQRLLRHWSAVAHERELGRELDLLHEQFDRRSRGELTSFELNERVHRFHQEKSREIFSRYTNNFHEMHVAAAIARGLIDRQELPEALRVYLKNRDR